MRDREGRALNIKNMGFLSPSPDRPPLASGEILKIYIRAALKMFSAEEVARQIENSGGGDCPDLGLYLDSLSLALRVPMKFFMAFTGTITSMGVTPRLVIETSLENRRDSPLLSVLLAHILSYSSGQRLSLTPVDMVSCACMAQRDYYETLFNYRMTDVTLERKSGSERSARLWQLCLFPESVHAVALDILAEILRQAPLPMREPMADVTHPLTDEVRLYGPFQGEDLAMGVRPSLRESARTMGMEIEVLPDCVKMDGVKVAVPEPDPGSAVADGMYRIVVDVENKSEGIVFRRPDSPFRRTDDLLLISGHRHHLDAPILFHDYRAHYSVRRVVHFAIFMANKLSAIIRQGGAGSADPWANTVSLIREQAAPRQPGGWDKDVQAVADMLADSNSLTPREREILVLVLRGRSNRLIARELSIETATVKSHVSSLLGKLGYANRRALISDLPRIKR